MFLNTYYFKHISIFIYLFKLQHELTVRTKTLKTMQIKKWNMPTGSTETVASFLVIWQFKSGCNS